MRALCVQVDIGPVMEKGPKRCSDSMELVSDTRGDRNWCIIGLRRVMNPRSGT